MRHILRERLAPQHATLDQAISARCFAADIDLPALLSIHATALPGLAAALEGRNISALYCGWDGETRLDLLRQDLSALGCPWPEPIGFQALQSDSHAAGLLYALEGSSLGNQILMRRIRTGGDTRHQQALRYLGHGGATSAWPRYIQWLDARSPELNPDAVVDGAAQAFAHYAASVQAHSAPEPN